MERKKDPSNPTQPEHPVGGLMPDDPVGMNPERIGFEIVLPDGTRIAIANDVTVSVVPSE